MYLSQSVTLKLKLLTTLMPFHPNKTVAKLGKKQLFPEHPWLGMLPQKFQNTYSHRPGFPALKI